MGIEKERENLREWSRGKVTTVLTVRQEMILGLCSVKQFRGFRVFFLLESVFTPPASPGSPYSKVTVWTTMPKGQPERRRKRRSRPTVNSYNGNLLGGFLLNHTLFWGHIFCPCVLFCFFHFLLFHWFFFFCISMFCFQSQPSSLWWEVAARETSQSLEHLGLPKLSSLIWSGLEPQNFVWAKHERPQFLKLSCLQDWLSTRFQAHEPQLAVSERLWASWRNSQVLPKLVPVTWQPWQASCFPLPVPRPCPHPVGVKTPSCFSGDILGLPWPLPCGHSSPASSPPASIHPVSSFQHPPSSPRCDTTVWHRPDEQMCPPITPALPTICAAPKVCWRNQPRLFTVGEGEHRGLSWSHWVIMW